MKKWQPSQQVHAYAGNPRQGSARDAVLQGSKFDAGKAKLELLFLEIGDATEELARVLGMGEEKYGLNNFDSFPDAKRRYEAALLRHMRSQIAGDYIDVESGLHHTAHVAANALFLLQMHIKEIRDARVEEPIG